MKHSISLRISIFQGSKVTTYQIIHHHPPTLDFTQGKQCHITEAFLLPVFEEISSSLYEMSGIEVLANAIALDTLTNPRGMTSAREKGSHIGPLRIRGPVLRIRLDLSNDEALVFEPQTWL